MTPEPKEGTGDEAVGIDGAHSRRWAIWHHQFDLVRSEDQVRYLRRWWVVKTPIGGIMLHRMDAPDARDTLHDHPFSFVSIVLRGGYVERRLQPRTMEVDERHRVHRMNVVRARLDAHAIRELLRVPTWTLLFVGRHRAKWGFLAPVTEHRWAWIDAHSYDSGLRASPGRHTMRSPRDA